MKQLRVWICAPALLLAALSGCNNDDNNSGSSSSSSSGSSSSSSSSSSGSSSSSSGAGATITLSGKLIAAALSGATVSAFPVKSDGTAGTTALGTATSSGDGSFSLTLPAGTAAPLDVLLVSSGGSYPSEANTTTTVTNAAGTGLSALLPQVSATGLSGIVVSPLTTLAVSRTQGVIAGAGPSAKSQGLGVKPIPHATCSGSVITCAASSADSLIKLAFGIASTSPLSTLAPDFSATTGDGAVLALVFGALEQEALSQSQPPANLIAALASDYFDGTPDGAGPGGGPVKFPGTTTTIPSTLGSSILISAMSTYLGNSTNPPVGVVTASNGTAIDPSVPIAIRSGVGKVAPQSAALSTSSSGAVSEIVVPSSGHQLLLVAARSFGLQGLDINNPVSPVLNSFSKLNTALAALKDSSSKPSLPTVDAVTAIPGQADAEAVLSSFDTAHLVLVDLDKQTVLKDSDFSATLKTQTEFSGGSAFISSSIYDPNVGRLGGVRLATGDGYYTYDVATQTLGTPIPLSASQIAAENLGGATSDPTLFSPGLLLSGNYGPGSGGGLQLVNLGTGTGGNTAYALDDAQFQSGFGVTQPGAGAAFPFGIVDGNAVDVAYHVGLITPEDRSYMGFIDLHDPSKFTFSGSAAAASFSAKSSGVMKSVYLADSVDEPILSGSAIESTNHLVLGIAAFSQTLLVGHLDDPTAPADGKTWAGLTDWRYYNAVGSEYNSTSADPHAVGALLASGNNKSYGVTLSINGSDSETLLLIDLQAFLQATAKATPSGGIPVHALAATPFGTPIIQTIALTDTFPVAAAVKRPAPKVQRKFGTITIH